MTAPSRSLGLLCSLSVLDVAALALEAPEESLNQHMGQVQHSFETLGLHFDVSPAGPEHRAGWQYSHLGGLDLGEPVWAEVEVKFGVNSHFDEREVAREQVQGNLIGELMAHPEVRNRAGELGWDVQDIDLK